MLDEARALIVTDTNRDQARHWRGSQDTRGHTEPGGPGTDVLDRTAADQRLEVFADDADIQTIAVQDGPVRAVASSYGEPFAYRPEDRAVMAIDGDPTTSWRVADHGDPLGERIRLIVDAADVSTTSLRLLQAPTPSGGRAISTVDISIDDGAPVEIALDSASMDGGQTVVIPEVTTGSTVEIEISGVAAGEPPSAAALAGVGFAEIDLGLGATTEWIRPPIDALDALARADTPPPLALVLTRLRVDPTDPWRADPEHASFGVSSLSEDHEVDATATLRLDRRASDADLAALLSPAMSGSAPIASGRITGGAAQRGASAVDGDPATAWMTPFDEVIGSSLRFDELGPLGDAFVLDQPRTQSSTITGIRIERFGTEAVDVAVPPPDADGRSTIALPPALSEADGPLTITITAIDPVTTIDRRYGDPRTLPAAISELTGTEGIDVVSLDRRAPIAASCGDRLAARSCRSTAPTWTSRSRPPPARSWTESR